MGEFVDAAFVSARVELGWVERIPASEVVRARIRELLQVWNERLSRNLTRSAYYDGVKALRWVGFAIPPEMRGLNTVLGWPRKAVRTLANRSVFDGFVAEGESSDPFGLRSLLAANGFYSELPQAITAAYKHGVSFVFVLPGDESSGEPGVVVQARSAERAAAVWDPIKRRIAYALSINQVDDSGRVKHLTYVDDEQRLHVEFGETVRVQAYAHGAGMAPVVALTYDPQLDRPFGQARLSDPAMYLTDAAARTLLRMETAAEFFSAPQRYVLGGDSDMFSDVSRWSVVMGRVLSITKDADGDVPQVGSFPQLQVQPLAEQLRMYAAMFAAEMSLPLNTLGIIHDNPASAEAMYAANEPLIIEANNQNRVLGGGLEQMARLMIQARDGAIPAEAWGLKAKWRNPATVSPVSAADALVKLNAVFPWLGDTTVALEMGGFTEDQITRLESDRMRAEGASTLRAILASASQPQPQQEQPQQPQEQSQEAAQQAEDVAGNGEA